MAKTVFYITEDQLEVYTVGGGVNPRVTPVGSARWTEETLVKAFVEIREFLKLKQVRLLLADDLSQLLLLRVVGEKEDLRDQLAERVKHRLPSVGEDWDFVEVTMKSGFKGRFVIVFAPKSGLWQALREAFEKAKVVVEAVESVAVAQKRHKNPVVGLALKEDIEGRDEEVLNMTIKKALEHKNTKTDKSKKGYLIAFLAVVVLAAIIIGGILVSRSAF